MGGPTLAIGYLNRPEVTKRRFVEVLLPGATQKERMYDTGDRGLVHPDSSIEVVGRMDYMVKIRGYSVVVPAVEAVSWLFCFPHRYGSILDVISRRAHIF